MQFTRPKKSSAPRFWPRVIASLSPRDPVPDQPGGTPTEALITMTSCHPKYSATERFVVHGHLVASVPRAEWDPSKWLTTPKAA